MAATPWQKRMKLVDRLIREYPNITFVIGDRFTWAPSKNTIYYLPEGSREGEFALLHELGHATLGHNGYKRDIELLKLEVEAWAAASGIGKKYSIKIDWQHIEHCINSYRDWLHARSSCPNCRTVSMQSDATTYQCHNCSTRWHVSKSRLCRIHRRRITTAAIA